MIATRLCATTLMLASLAWPQAPPTRLEGCSDPVVLAKALGTFVKADWTKLSNARAKAMWPNPLQGIECNTQACSALDFKGRVIGGDYECSELFRFSEMSGAVSGQAEQLESIVINYATARRETTIDAARALVGDLGLATAELEKLGKESSQSVTWSTTIGQKLSALLINFDQLGTVWSVQVRLSQFQKRPPFN